MTNGDSGNIAHCRVGVKRGKIGRVRRLITWIRARGFQVRPGRRYAIADGVVTYRPGDPHETQLRGLLHEAGHILFWRTHGWRPSRNSVEQLREEIEAWHRGWRLGQRLGLRLDAAAYWRDCCRSVRTYMRG